MDLFCAPTKPCPFAAVLYSVSSDKTIHCIDVAAGRIVAKLANAHAAAINVALVVPDGHLLATGDDDGVVKVSVGVCITRSICRFKL